ncbi:glycosyltransferase family 4 protein [Sphingomonas piscis]|uniref:Glycosyltransferase family 4 protein n=1 Tax=Sphingomonas piscis TaxID=2714943 RepID=A0A6G7YMV7_9SPHN|nr:glycosyltransferase family 4 protein [Sphingomonas piscis]QIK78072.1 glycosyltransferase family 4 protein [Sphingomonas piscis]
MDIAPTFDLTLSFEGASVTPVSEDAGRSRPLKIGWLIKSVEVDSASIRYRCFHFARVLSPGFRSTYFTSTEDLLKKIGELDAIVIVKRIDQTVVDVVAKARLFQVPVFMDFCDDMLAPGYVKNEFGVNMLRFLGMAPFLAGVTVPSAEMADRIQGYACDNGVSGLKVHNIPDVAETWDVYRETYEFVTGWTLPEQLPPPSTSSAADRKRIVWFGNYGASHSNFGIYTLRPSLKSLYRVNEDVPLELIVVSNSEPVYQALVQGCGFPTRYVPWSAPAVYAELAAADAALLTTGDDAFCEIKSSTRVLQAFAAGVPVISGKGAAVSEFDEAIPSGKMRDALRACIGPQRERVLPQRLAEASRVLTRYAPERIGKLWAGLLTNAIAAAKCKPGGRCGKKLLIVIEPGNNLRAVTKLVKMLRHYDELDYELMVSTQLLESDSRFWNVLRSSRRIPRFFSGKPKGVRGLLVDCSAIVVERLNAPIAQLFRHHAHQLDVPVLTNAEAVYGGLSAFVGESPAPRPSAIRAGPFPERLNDDGSVDWAFMVHEKSRGWILDAISREIGSRQPASWQVVYYPAAPPPTKNYFFSHHSLFETFVARESEMLADAKIFVWYTHPRIETPESIARLLVAFDRATKIIFTCESNRQVWLDRGLPEEKTVVILGAADPQLFQYHARSGSGVVGLSSAFYERKNPDVLLEVIKRLPHRQFLLLGRNWNQYALFEEMLSLSNFTYKTARYSEYGKIYSDFDVFLSISRLEGGPIPLIEAMMSNAVPVASRTGFAPEIIRHGQNGFLFDTDADAGTIADLIESAYELTGNVRATVDQFT